MGFIVGHTSCPIPQYQVCTFVGFPDGASRKESACNAGDASDAGSIPGWGRSPERGNGNPLQYSCLGNPMDRGAWRAMVHADAKIGT